MKTLFIEAKYKGKIKTDLLGAFGQYSLKNLEIA